MRHRSACFERGWAFVKHPATSVYKHRQLLRTARVVPRSVINDDSSNGRTSGSSNDRLSSSSYTSSAEGAQGKVIKTASSTAASTESYAARHARPTDSTTPADQVTHPPLTNELIVSAAAGAAAGYLIPEQHQQYVKLPQKAEMQPLPGLVLETEARRYYLLSLAKLCAGSLLVLAPQQFMSAALNSPPTALEVMFARLMGVALLFRGLIAQLLKSASERGRLHSTTSQRIMLGCILPSFSHLVSFKSIMSQWGAQWNWGLLSLYPAVLASELFTHMAAFQVYHPYFMIKMLFPFGYGLVMAQLMPPLPPLGTMLPRNFTPVTAGAAMLLSHKGIRWLAKMLGPVVRVSVRAGMKYMRAKRIGQMFTKLLPEAGPPLTATVVRMMDFVLPSTALAWGYWFMMLQHFATMMNAFMPEQLFVGTVTPISRLLKQSWSAGFLAAAFASDALKTAADRRHLALEENRQANLCLALLEAGFAACLVTGMSQGVVVVNTYSHLRLATAVASVVFCMGVWWSSTKEAEAKGWPQVPSVSSYDWQEEAERRVDYGKITSIAVVALNVVVSFI